MQNLSVKNSLLFLGLIFSLLHSSTASAQDDLLSMIDSIPSKPVRSLPAFKTTRIVNSHSVETVKAHHLDFRVTHHFGDAGVKGGGHTIFGLDNASDIRIAFEYGVTERLTVAAGRSKIGEMIDAYLKYRLLYQTEDNRVPLSLTLFANAAVSAVDDINGPLSRDFNNRLSYTYEALIARRFNSRLSWQLMPVFLHRNFVADPSDENDLFALGTGARLKLTKHFALLADYYLIFSGYRSERQELYFPPLGIGIEIETGGHVFHLHFTNNPGIIENSYLANSTDSWTKGEFKFGFNISRTFGIGKKSRSSE